MKLKLGILFLAVLSLILLAKWRGSNDVLNDSFISKISSSKQASAKIGDSFLSSVAPEVIESASASSAASSVNSLSGARVDPLPEIANFLRQLDSAALPPINLPNPKRNFGFDYAKAKPSELRQKALEDDPYAAYFYAEHLIKSSVRTATDKGDYAYELDHTKRALALDEAREFYIRGFRGGIASIADVLSRLYANPARGGNRVEALAWRKISFAVGESQRYNCLRNSTICVVKDFNNLNRLEIFYPCLSATGDSCSQIEYDNAMVLALEYADSLEYAMHRKVGQ